MRHKKYKVAVIQIVRHIIQLISFILFPGLFVITYSAIKNTVVTLINGSFTFVANGSDLILAAAISIINNGQQTISGLLPIKIVTDNIYFIDFWRIYTGFGLRALSDSVNGFGKNTSETNFRTFGI